jgi:hypothetical protein
MPLQFTSNRRTVFKRKRVNHQAHPNLTEVSPRIVASHIKTWLKEEGYLVNG